MNRILIVLLTITVSMVTGCVFSMNDDYEKGVGTSTYSVSGMFTDGNGAAIEGMTVVLSGDSDATVLTDAGGTYVFEDISPGSYMVTPGNKGPSSKSISVINGNVDVGTNSDGHGSKVNGDYTCSKCH